eukprot:sb/3476885/
MRMMLGELWAFKYYPVLTRFRSAGVIVLVGQWDNIRVRDTGLSCFVLRYTGIQLKEARISITIGQQCENHVNTFEIEWFYRTSWSVSIKQIQMGKGGGAIVLWHTESSSSRIS